MPPPTSLSSSLLNPLLLSYSKFLSPSFHHRTFLPSHLLIPSHSSFLSPFLYLSPMPPSFPPLFTPLQYLLPPLSLYLSSPHVFYRVLLPHSNFLSPSFHPRTILPSSLPTSSPSPLTSTLAPFSPSPFPLTPCSSLSLSIVFCCCCSPAAQPKPRHRGNRFISCLLPWRPVPPATGCRE